ncbi:hypothetical protein Tco_0607003 [Tanacetum coccineum]
MPATTVAPPLEIFSGGIFRPTPKTSSISGSPRSTSSLPATRRPSPPGYHSAAAPMEHASTTTSNIITTQHPPSSSYHHQHPVTPPPSPPKPPPQPPPPKGARGFITTTTGAFDCHNRGTFGWVVFSRYWGALVVGSQQQGCVVCGFITPDEGAFGVGIGCGTAGTAGGQGLSGWAVETAGIRVRGFVVISEKGASGCGGKGRLAVGTAIGPFGSRVRTKGALGLVLHQDRVRSV